MPDLPPIPASGVLKLQRGQVYTVAKTVNLRSCIIIPDGDPGLAAPVIKYSGPDESAAISVIPGETVKVSGITFGLGNHTYAFENPGDLTAIDVRFAGGGGLCKIVGSSFAGDTNLIRCTQLSTASHWVIYAGPKVFSGKGTDGKPTYSEQCSGNILIYECNLTEGSAWNGNVRAQAFTTLTVVRSKIVDTDEQSAIGADGKRAVKNGTFRAHYGGLVTVNESTIIGDVFCGGLNSHDASGPGSDGGDTLPPGPERSFKEKERVIVNFADTTFKSPVFTAAPGSTVDFKRCRDVPGISFPPTFMNRPVGVVTMDTSTTRAKPTTRAGG